MIKGLTLSTIIVFSFFLSIAQQYAWVPRANFLGGDRYGAFSFTIGNKGYVGSGVTFTGGNINYSFIDFWEYDPITDSWTQKANIPGVCIREASGFSLGSKGYFTTGWSPNQSDQTYEYNPVTNSWASKSNFGGGPRYTCASFTVGSFAYVGMGYLPYYNDFWKYDPISDTWTQVANIGGVPRQAAKAFTIGTYGYVFGGGQQSGTFLSDLWQYNPSTNSWAQKATCPCAPRSAGFAFEYKGFGFAGTGCDDNNVYQDVYRYDPSNDSWLQIVDFGGTTRVQPASVTIGNRAFVGTGSLIFYPNTILTNDWWELVEVTQAPIANFNCNDSIWCEKNCVDFYDLSTSSPTSWQWTFTGANPSSSTLQNPSGICYNTYGAFPVTMVACKNGTCDTVTKQNYIIINQSPAIPTITQSNDTLYSSTAYAYQWFELSNPTTILSTNNYYVVTQPGTYYVMVYDVNGCNTPSSIYVYAGVNEYVDGMKFEIYPNPVSEALNVNLSSNLNESIALIEIEDMGGKTILSKKIMIENGKLKFDVSSLGKGKYYLSIFLNGEKGVTSFIKI